MKDYLGLPNQRSDIVIGSAPLNSSGDIYHITAYVILSLAKKKDIPKILLGRDKTPHDDVEVLAKNINTGDQVARALFFAQSLGLGQYFSIFDVTLAECTQPFPRQEKLEHDLITAEHERYVDHRLTTSIISAEILADGREETTKVLQQGFTNMDTDFLTTAVKKSVIDYATNQSALLRETIGRKDLVIIHYRYSVNANSAQAMESYAQDIVNYLNTKGLSVAVIYVDPRKQIRTTFTNTVFTVRPFQQGNIVSGKDVAKLRHLHLLNELKSFRSLKGIIGNTSGTLDLAGLLGHRIFNIHDFATSTVDVGDKIKYQDYRLLLQITFLTIQARSEHTGANNSVLLLNLLNWLNNSQQRSKKTVAMQRPKLHEGGDASANKGFSYFSSVKTLSSRSNTRGQWHRCAFFEPRQQQIETMIEEAGFIAPLNQ